ncbi:MAG TPA: PHP domain-containing protein [Thermomicrobiales bacterium]|nr:PHP domain-containing protein [Thermomicrobiales bacterium]
MLDATDIRLRADDPIDLHLHTFQSDGVWTPMQLIDHLAEAGITVAAVCDHETQRSVVEAIEYGERRGIYVIPGVEVTVRHDDRQWHMLIYGIRPDDDRAEARPFLEMMREHEASLYSLARANWARVERTGRVLPSLETIVGDGKMWTYPEVLVAMIRDGHAPNLTIAANMITELGGRFNADIPIEEVVSKAHEAGGVCVMAHPGRPDLGPAMTAETLAKLLADAPVDGLECHYRTYTDRDTAFFRSLAGQHGLVTSAGSDSHGLNTPVNPRPFRAVWAKSLLERLGVVVDDPVDEPVWAPGMDPLAVKPQRKKRGKWKRRQRLGRFWRRKRA